MIISSISFYVIGIIVIWVLSEIRANLSLIVQRLEWINEDIRKLAEKEDST